MIVVSRKRLTIILCLIMVSIFTFLIMHNEKNMEYGFQTVPTVALPVSNKVIVVDAGHRYSRRGCTK